MKSYAVLAALVAGTLASPVALSNMLAERDNYGQFILTLDSDDKSLSDRLVATFTNTLAAGSSLPLTVLPMGDYELSKAFSAQIDGNGALTVDKPTGPSGSPVGIQLVSDGGSSPDVYSPLVSTQQLTAGWVIRKSPATGYLNLGYSKDNGNTFPGFLVCNRQISTPSGTQSFDQLIVDYSQETDASVHNKCKETRVRVIPLSQLH